MLWGASAMIIPIAIHFWHQKRGKQLDWAATNWLFEKDLQSSNGLRLDKLLLLLLRCILLILLCFLLSKPLVKWFNRKGARQKVHLVQPDPAIIENYKFELENALAKGEKCYWLTPTIELLEDLKKPPVFEKFQANTLQIALNKLNESTDNQLINLYFINQQSLLEVPQFFISANYTLHSLKDSTKKAIPFLAFSPQKRVYINASNQLVSEQITADNSQFETQATHKGSLHVLMNNQDLGEKATIKATLKALTKVYDFDFTMVEKPEAGTQYDLIFDNQLPKKSVSSQTLFVISNAQKLNNEGYETQQNIALIPDLLHPQSSNLVFEGNFPAYLGALIIQHFDLQHHQYALSQQQIKALFKVAEYPKKIESEWFSKTLLLIFILILSIERWLAIRKNS